MQLGVLFVFKKFLLVPAKKFGAKEKLQLKKNGRR